VYVREIYETFAGRLVAQVYGLTGDYAEAQDVVQETFARALARPRWLTELDNPEAWLRTVALNIVRSRRRSRAVFTRLVRSGRLDPADVPAVSPDRVVLVAALQRIAPRLREALVLHYIADLSVAEVAAVLGCSADAVKTRLLRGRRALANELDDTNSKAVNYV
jgi:RNA polymerase sigma-70 factor (ECF subfamily)